MNNNKEFFDNFKKIEHKLTYIVGDNISSFPELLKSAKKNQHSIAKYSKELNDLSLIRTLVAHKKREHLVTIPDGTIKLTKEILQHIYNPPTVLDKFGKKVTSCDSEDNLLKVLDLMKTKVFTHIPVYNREKFKGILSEATVTSWIIHKKKADITNTKVKELSKFLNINDNEIFNFIPEDEDAYKVKNLFLDSLNRGQRIGAFFITKNGYKEEKLKGIITSWDIPKLH